MAASRRFDAVVFDLLTALIDSWTLWNRAAGSAEDGLRWRRQYLELTYAAGRYRPYEAIVREAAIGSGVDATAADRLIALWPELPLWPETPRILDRLASRVPLGVATNCSKALGMRAVERTGGHFAAVVTAEAAGFYKPRPEPYRAVLGLLGTDAGRTLFVAGSAADVPGAKSVGMPVFWHNRMELRPLDNAKPDYVAASLEPLLDIVL
jgi:2-haloalkanoic acid dehalogenase type II